MGFKLNINTILRYEVPETTRQSLQVGAEYPFEKDELCILADDIQIWLTRKDWTAVAEIQVTSQTRKNKKTVGTFVVKYMYSEAESAALTAIFRRMYGWV